MNLRQSQTPPVAMIDPWGGPTRYEWPLHEEDVKDAAKRLIPETHKWITNTAFVPNWLGSKTFIIGPCKASEVYTSEQIGEMGYVGLYIENDGA